MNFFVKVRKIFRRKFTYGHPYNLTYDVKGELLEYAQDVFDKENKKVGIVYTQMPYKEAELGGRC